MRRVFLHRIAAITAVSIVIGATLTLSRNRGYGEARLLLISNRTSAADWIVA